MFSSPLVLFFISFFTKQIAERTPRDDKVDKNFKKNLSCEFEVEQHGVWSRRIETGTDGKKHKH